VAALAVCEKCGAQAVAEAQAQVQLQLQLRWQGVVAVGGRWGVQEQWQAVAVVEAAQKRGDEVKVLQQKQRETRSAQRVEVEGGEKAAAAEQVLVEVEVSDAKAVRLAVTTEWFGVAEGVRADVACDVWVWVWSGSASNG
jgi:hypothetical protein